jgi:hypothetical protein
MSQFHQIRCKGCSEPIPLLNANLSETGVGLRKLPTDAGTLQVVCPYCSAAHRYERAEVYLEGFERTPSSKKLENTNPVHTTIGCVMEGCGNIYQVLSWHKKGEMNDSKIKSLCAVLMGARPAVCCPDNHPIKAPSPLGPFVEWK